MADIKKYGKTPPIAQSPPRPRDQGEDAVIVQEEVTEFGRKRLLEREAKRMLSDVAR